MPVTTTPEPFVDSQEAARFLCCQRSWLHDNQARLDLPRYKVGNQYRYRLSEVAVWVETHRKGLETAAR